MYNKINIDFQIYDSRDPKVFILIDTSEWVQIKDKPAIIEIIVPGDNTPIKHYLEKNSVNVLNSVNLFLNCHDYCKEDEASLLDLPDGIYDVTIKGSPDNFQKNRQYLRTTKTQLELDKLFVGLSLECYNDNAELKAKISKLNEIQMLLKAAEANLRYNNNCVAQDLFHKAQDLISKTKKCKNCV